MVFAHAVRAMSVKLVCYAYCFLCSACSPAPAAPPPGGEDRLCRGELVVAQPGLAPVPSWRRAAAPSAGQRNPARCRLKHARTGTPTGRTPAIRACPPRSSGSCPPASRPGRSSGRCPRNCRCPLMNYGYEGEVLLPVELIAVPKDWPAGQPAKLAARVDWLVCKDVCIPARRSRTHLAGVNRSPAPDPPGAPCSSGHWPRCPPAPSPTPVRETTTA